MLVWVAFITKDANANLDSAEKNKCQSTDLVFVIDNTYSLSSTIYDIKVAAAQILDQLSHLSDGKLRLGLVTFKDHVEVLEDLNAAPNVQEKIATLHKKIDSIRASGGAAGPEASDEALRTVVHALSATDRRQSGDFSGKFEADTRIIIIVTDNLPGGFDDRFKKGVDDVNAAERAMEASAQNINISSIYVPTSYYSNDTTTENIMRDYALITGGLFIKIDPSGKGAAKAVADIIQACGRRPMV
ncbi:MAG: vWA domain-containing protein [Alphaproteobacteria bacterium]|nr:vWA domain-containing protein [Alphaproteobacteria bacterium]